jgi:hypothetical protein
LGHHGGRAAKSDGTLLRAGDWRANRLADALAKAAAARGRTTAKLRTTLAAAQKLLGHTLGLLGATAFEANNYKHSVWGPNGQLVTATVRDSAPPPLWKGRRGKRVRPARRRAASEGTAPHAALAAQAAQPAALPQRPGASGRARSCALAEAARCELRFRETWRADLDKKNLQPAAGPSAADRMAALRARLASPGRTR